MRRPVVLTSAAPLPSVALLVIFLGFIPVAGLAQQPQQEEERGFIEGIASTIYAAAWPTATYEGVTIGGFSRTAGGVDATVRLFGESMFGGPLWLDLTLSLRDGRLHDLKVTRHNAVLMEPFATTKAIGTLLVDLAESYVENSAARAEPPPGPRTFPLRVSNECHLPLAVWARYRSPSGDWVTGGNWSIGGLENLYLNGGTDENPHALKVSSRVVYSYAEPLLDGTGLSWGGDRAVRYGDRTLSMSTDTLRADERGELVLTRNCTNIRRIGAEGQDADPYQFQGRTYTAGGQIVRVSHGSPAASRGLRPGDVIYRVDDEVVSDWATLVRLMVRKSAEPITLSVIRDGADLRIEFSAWEGR